ncbi:hypothetical protein WUBG_17059, partial [Wuchereria bancrofti]
NNLKRRQNLLLRKYYFADDRGSKKVIVMLPQGEVSEIMIEQLSHLSSCFLSFW